jgi:enamine deaminase RidA (YjgF/YER057c/UK114 family)
MANDIRRKDNYKDILHEVVEHNGVLYLAGLVSENLLLDITGQTEDVLRQLNAVLKANGSGMDRVLTGLLFITDMNLKPALNEAWKKHFNNEAHLPTRACIGVKDLGPNVLLEAVFTAAVASGKSKPAKPTARAPKKARR